MRKIAGLVLLLAACGGDVGDAEYAAQALDSTESGSTESALLATAGDGMASAAMTTPEATTKAAVLRWPGRFLPAGCATATSTGSTAVYKLDNCTGPYGLLHVTGTVTVVYTITNGVLGASATATGLLVNGATVDVNATGTYMISGASQTVSVMSNSSGTGVRGNQFTRKGEYTVEWDASCVSLDGDWSTTVAGHTWSTTVSGYHRCTGMCPTAGGEVSFTGGISGVTVTVTTDGSGVAKWSTSRGHSGTVNLYCTL